MTKRNLRSIIKLLHNTYETEGVLYSVCTLRVQLEYSTHIMKCQVKKETKTKNPYMIVEDTTKMLIDAVTGEVLEILSDKKQNGKERPWREHKVSNMKLKEVYAALAENESESEYYNRKAERLEKCGNTLTFNVYNDENGGQYMKVAHAESCRVRLCPLCAWRRSLKIHTHTRKILDKMQESKDYEYILLTLTVPNVTEDELNEIITHLFKSWDRLCKRKEWKKAIKGWYRALEITHNVDKNSKSYDTYHPHFHCILAVNKSYFTDSNQYITHDKWLELWREVTRDNRITQVDVRKVKTKKGETDIVGAVCETAKYTVKSGDYIIPSDWDMTVSSVRCLDRALQNRRLVAYGGIMKEIHKQLNLDDEIDGNLMNDDDDNINGEIIMKKCFIWNVGYQQYTLRD